MPFEESEAGLGPRFFPFGHPPSFAFSRDDRAFAFDEIEPSIAAGLISFPQWGHLICIESFRSKSPVIKCNTFRANLMEMPAVMAGGVVVLLGAHRANRSVVQLFFNSEKLRVRFHGLTLYLALGIASKIGYNSLPDL